jgi:predicted AAA+ superfamily ATPase
MQEFPIFFILLIYWTGRPYRKPLILKGVRQVGKTWILKELDGDVLNIPLFMADQTDRLIGLALDSQKN